MEITSASLKRASVLDPARADRRRGLSGQILAPGDNLHPKKLCVSIYDFAAPAETEKAERLAVQDRACRGLPPAFAHAPMFFGQVAGEIPRSLVKAIILTPEAGELKIDVRGDLAGILAISLKTKTPALGLGFRKLRWLRGLTATDADIR
jgi:hypothetical protein